ncbi:phage terminase small subunit [Shouchella lehensis]|uniref:PBSX phage terminase small subunit-like N-terminal domain-containing protein n=1 Tax=Shouchella lehensis TaxID=300825 RepID=A0A4Y7WDH9_9BACI|nr:phage terminase small subunit [Shouchella lehensis]MBG9783578.1 hypothetical protein [Shouchella lehensis]TES45667.1 hypothetical protein E2L03_19995 [Shouchella lehensis]
MARQRDPRREEAYEIWKATGKPLKEIAEELDCSPSQIRKWKSQDRWGSNGNVTDGKESVTKKNAPKKKPSGNRNPMNQFTKRNEAARKHGLRSKYFNESQREIMQDFEGFTISDQLWIQIEITFSAIIQLQKIMWVESRNDTLIEESTVSESEGGSSTSFKVMYAHEQYESYIKAQTRAMAEYRNLIKQFTKMAHENDERLLKLEQMQLNVSKTKAEVNLLSNEHEKYEDDGFINAIKSASEQVWNDEKV